MDTCAPVSGALAPLLALQGQQLMFFFGWVMLILAVVAGGLVVFMARHLAAARAAAAAARAGQEAAENRWRVFMQNAPELVLLLDPEGKVLFVNHSIGAFEGIRLEGSPFVDLVEEEFREPFLGVLAAVREKGLPQQLELPVTGSGGVQKLFDLQLAPLERRNGYWCTFSLICHDMTDQRQVEDQLRHSLKMESVGRLAGGVAHDFNNLLTVIQCNTMLVREALDESQAEARTELDETVKAAERAANLTQQLLAFSRRQMIKPGYHDLRQVVADMTRMLGRVITENIQLQGMPHSDPLPVFVDRGQIEQVIMNLVINARDAMPTGGTLSLRSSLETVSAPRPHQHGILEPGRYCTLAVADTGTGIAPEVLPVIFEPYFTTKEPGKGSGLGLSMVYGIIQQHEGAITCQTKVGKGSVFTIYLRYTEVPPHATVKPVRSYSQTTPLPRVRTILIVEDEVSVRSIAKRLLEKEGYNVLVAADGEEALRLADGYRDEIHLLFTDVVMPGTSGAELARLLAAKRPRMKVLFTSGYTESTVIRHGLSGAAIEFLHKPFSTPELAGKVHKMLFGRADEAEGESP